MAKKVMIISVPFEVSLKGYPEGTTVDQAAEQEAEALREGVYGVDEFIGDREYFVRVENDT